MNCAPASLVKRPPFATSSSNVPVSTIWPRSNTKILSALRIVARRCAMMKVVRPFVAVSKRELQLSLRLGIQRRARLVEDHDRRIFQKRAGDREPLAFAAGKRAAAFADHGRQAIPLLSDKIFCLRPCERLRNFGGARVELADLQVLLDRTGEQHRFLENDADIAAKSGERHVADVNSIDLDVPSLRVEDAMQEAESCRSCRSR